MGKKKTIMKFPSIFKSRDSEKPWEWPSCKHPKTLSFRAAAGDVVFKTVNSIFFDPFDGLETSDSLFTNSSESASASNSTATESGRHEIDGQSLETVVRGARSERLFFEPDDTSSILEKSKPNSNSNPEELGLGLGYKESLIVSMESENPYEDFRKSMGEMVESHGVRDWEGLEELLGWYLRANWKKNHGFIIGAFVDLLVQILLASSSCSSDSNYYTCTESSSSSLDPSLRQEIDEEDDDDDDDDDDITEIM